MPRCFACLLVCLAVLLCADLARLRGGSLSWVWPGGLGEHFVPGDESVERLAESEPRATHAHVLQQPQVAHLMQVHLVVEDAGFLEVVWFDASHVVRLRGGQGV